MGKKILLVEDNEGDQLLIKEALSETDLHYELVVTSSGEEGVAKAALLKPDIVITDTNLPGMDGFKTCRKIKEALNDVKVIIYTGVVDVIDAGKAREAGADDYCVKVSNCEPLIKAIHNCFKN